MAEFIRVCIEYGDFEEASRHVTQLVTLAEAIKKHPRSPKAQENFWMKKTGQSRATYFRVKQRAKMAKG